MMRLIRRTPFLAAVYLLTSAATASAECAWVLWSKQAVVTKPEHAPELTLEASYKRVEDCTKVLDRKLSFAKISANSVDRAANARVTRQGNARRRWTVESEEGNQILGPIRPPRKEVKVRGSALTEGRARA